MKKALILSILLVALLFNLAAEENGQNVNLDIPGLRAGVELGLPISGVTAGYHMNETLEANVVVGYLLNYNSLALGGSLLFKVVSFETQRQVLPLNVGPVAFASFGSDALGFSAGGIARIEYDFAFPLNLYFQAGMLVNIVKEDGDPLFNWPFALGVRYIF